MVMPKLQSCARGFLALTLPPPRLSLYLNLPGIMQARTIAITELAFVCNSSHILLHSLHSSLYMTTNSKTSQEKEFIHTGRRPEPLIMACFHTAAPIIQEHIDTSHQDGNAK
jgi:hypothetical protein